MKANTQYIASDGYEYFMCPFTNMYITQGSNSDYSHAGVMANDVTNGDTSKAPYYAPFTCRCFVIYSDYGQSSWVSTSPVHFANGHLGYAMFTIAHDETQDCYVGQVVNQGSQIGNMGAKGIGTGVHCHIQIGAGNDCQWGFVKGYWSYNGVTYPTYGFSSEPYDLDDCYFVDDTNILYGMGGNWKKTGSASVTSSSSTSTNSSVVSFDDMEEERYAVEFINDEPIVIHNENSSGYSIGTMSKGEKQIYTRKGVGNGHRWIGWKETVGGKEYKCVCAISGSEVRGEEMWVKLYDPDETSTQTETKVETTTVEKTEQQPSTSNKKYGVDISTHNGDFEVSKYEFVIIRATWGTNEDDLFKSNVDKCVKAGVPWGVYCYSYALDDEGAQSEAEYLIGVLEKYNLVPDLGCYYDLEDADSYKAKNGFDYNNEQSICKIFCDYISGKGYYVGVYTTKYWNDNYVHTNYPLWIANWNVNDGAEHDDFSDIAVIHQYAAVNNIDYDVCYVDFDSFKSNPSNEKSSSHDSNENGTDKNVSTEEDASNKTVDEQSKQSVETDESKTLINLLIKLVKKILSLFGIE